MALPGTACAEDALGSRLLSVLSAPSMYDLGQVINHLLKLQILSLKMDVKYCHAELL